MQERGGGPRSTGKLWIQLVGSVCKPSGCFFWAYEFPENQNHGKHELNSPLLSSHRSQTDHGETTGVLG